MCYGNAVHPVAPTECSQTPCHTLQCSPSQRWLQRTIAAEAAVPAFEKLKSFIYRTGESAGDVIITYMRAAVDHPQRREGRQPPARDSPQRRRRVPARTQSERRRRVPLRDGPEGGRRWTAALKAMGDGAVASPAALSSSHAAWFLRKRAARVGCLSAMARLPQCAAGPRLAGRLCRVVKPSRAAMCMLCPGTQCAAWLPALQTMIRQL